FLHVTGVQRCALPISWWGDGRGASSRTSRSVAAFMDPIVRGGGPGRAAWGRDGEGRDGGAGRHRGAGGERGGRYGGRFTDGAGRSEERRVGRAGRAAA